MTTKTDEAVTLTVTPVSAEQFAKHNAERESARRVESKRHSIEEYRATAAKYQDKVDASRVLASSIRGFITSLESDARLADVSFESLTDALYAVKNGGEYQLQYVDEYTRKADRLQAELDGDKSAETGRSI
jgi:hypothetical protein